MKSTTLHTSIQTPNTKAQNPNQSQHKSTHQRLLQINLDRVNQPKRLPKRPRVLPNILLTRPRQIGTTTTSPHAPSPRPTEGRIKHKILIFKRPIEITPSIRPTLKRSKWLAPSPGIRSLGRDIRWYFATDPEPHVDARGGPLHGVDAAAEGVEAAAEVLRRGGAHGTTFVGGGEVAVCGLGDGAGLGVGVRYCAPWRRVEGYGVCELGIDAFNYVDFTGGGPVGSVWSQVVKVTFGEQLGRRCGCDIPKHPESRPSSTTDWHVSDICDEQSLI